MQRTTRSLGFVLAVLIGTWLPACGGGGGGTTTDAGVIDDGGGVQDGLVILGVAPATVQANFNTPVVIDGEGFWGNDRLWMVKRWLDWGGW